MFSIIIPIGPSRDGSHALGSLAESGLGQDDEVIVVGDGHLPTVQGYKSQLHLKIFKTSLSCGANAARNLGANEATKEFVCFLDDDDEYLPDSFRLIKSFLQKNPNVKVCTLGYKTLSGKPMLRSRNRIVLTEKDIWKRNIAGGCSGMVIKRDLFFKAGGFDNDMESMQDWDLWLRLVQQSVFHVFNAPCILYRDHNEPRISTDPSARIAGLTRLLKKHGANWPASVCSFHQARLAAEKFKAGKGRWISIFQVKAPLASLYFLLKVISR